MLFAEDGNHLNAYEAHMRRMSEREAHEESSFTEESDSKSDQTDSKRSRVFLQVALSSKMC